MDYKILSAHDIGSLNKLVNEAISLNFKPLGGVSVVHYETTNKNSFYQAVIKSSEGVN